MTRFILVRHGESTANLARIFVGYTDAALTARGLAQAELTADYMAAHYRVDAVYASDLRRAYDTAACIARRYDLPVEKERAFREIYAGAWEGVPFEELAVRDADAFLTWRLDIGRARCTGGESFLELQARAMQALASLSARHAGQTVVIGTHATPIRAIEAALRGADADGVRQIPFVANASLTVVDYEAGRGHFVLRGYHDHHGELTTGLPRGASELVDGK